MKKCKRCGADISHQTHSTTTYCQREDNPECVKARHAEQRRKKTMEAAVKRNRLCPICGKLIMSPTAETCSRQCVAAIRKKKAEENKGVTVDLLSHQTFPYNMPYDPIVSPADINPMGGGYDFEEGR